MATIHRHGILIQAEDIILAVYLVRCYLFFFQRAFATLCYHYVGAYCLLQRPI